MILSTKLSFKSNDGLIFFCTLALHGCGTRSLNIRINHHFYCSLLTSTLFSLISSDRHLTTEDVKSIRAFLVLSAKQSLMKTRSPESDDISSILSYLVSNQSELFINFRGIARSNECIRR